MPEKIQKRPVNEGQNKTIVWLIAFIAALIAWPCLTYLFDSAAWSRSEREPLLDVLLRNLFVRGPGVAIIFSIYWLLPLILNIRLLVTARRLKNRKLISVSILFFFLLALPFIIFLGLIIFGAVMFFLHPSHIS